MPNCDKWITSASRCNRAAEGFEPYHKWIVLSEIVTQTSRITTGIMCGVCFQQVELSEAHKHRDAD